MRIVYFTHSLESCWNHGNAHFLRGVLRELSRGHEVLALEPATSWSRENLLADQGEAGLDPFRRHFPMLRTQRYACPEQAVELAAGADAVVVHEWNEPALVAALGRARRASGRFTLLFHDTHHRAVSDPRAIAQFDLDGYDAVLAFGEALAEVYRGWGWNSRAFVWHEAADTALFRPPPEATRRDGLVWIGNWGDEERSTELVDYLLRPARQAGLALDVHGVRYPPAARRTLAEYGARHRGWLANPEVPGVFAAALATVHVPRRLYVTRLPGIPTIRMFEALACGIPLASAPWQDVEGLFRAGEDYLLARTPAEMTAHLRTLAADAGLRRRLAATGRATIEARHTCAHRAAELLGIVTALRGMRVLLELAA